MCLCSCACFSDRKWDIVWKACVYVLCVFEEWGSERRFGMCVCVLVFDETWKK